MLAYRTGVLDGVFRREDDEDRGETMVGPLAMGWILSEFSVSQ